MIKRLWRSAQRWWGHDGANRREQYEAVWDSAAQSEHDAKMSVVGFTDEDMMRHTGEITADRICRATDVGPTDTVLEIGAGVGRIGEFVAPRCESWIGADVSTAMLGHLERRLRGHDNVSVVKVSGYDLEPVGSGSVDVVYCTVVFMHLEEWDRYNYVLEAARVLRPGGRIYVDNFNLCAEKGWQLFEDLREGHRPLDRPPQISKSSTPDELRHYLERAGFADVAVDEYDELWVAAHGRLGS